MFNCIIAFFEAKILIISHILTELSIRYKVTLSRDEREGLLSLTKNRKRSPRKVIHALILLNSDEGEEGQKKRTTQEISAFLQTRTRTIERIKKRFVEDGLPSALENKPAERKYK
jgi:hypothetical protein